MASRSIPYYTVKDIFGVGVFFVLFAIVVFFVPTLRRPVPRGAELRAGQSRCRRPSTSRRCGTSRPYYAILRAVPDQRMGALLMLLAVVSFLFLPWLDRSPVKSMRYRGWMSRTALALFAVSFIVLGYLGMQPPQGLYVVLARIFARHLFRVLLADAVLHPLRQGEAGA